MTAPYIKTHPSFSEVRRRKNKEPWRLWIDDQGRLYGRRTDPAFEEDEEGAGLSARQADTAGRVQPWFLQLPTQDLDEDFDEEEVLLPEADDEFTVTNLAYINKPPDQQRKALIRVVDFPERIERNQKTSSVNVVVLKVTKGQM